MKDALEDVDIDPRQILGHRNTSLFRQPLNGPGGTLTGQTAISVNRFERVREPERMFEPPRLRHRIGVESRVRILKLLGFGAILGLENTIQIINGKTTQTQVFGNQTPEKYEGAGTVCKDM